jgi:hypothetical protein
MERESQRRVMTQEEFDWQAESPRKRASVSPEQLDHAVKATLDLLPIRVSSRHTAKAYRTAIRYFGAWYFFRFGMPLETPFPTDVVLQFLRDHLAQSADPRAVSVDDFALKPERACDLPEEVEEQLIEFGYKRVHGGMGQAQLRTALAALIRGRRDSTRFPTRPDIRFFSREDLLSMREFHDLMNHHALPNRSTKRHREPITPDLFESMVATCRRSMQDRRDRALLHFGWIGGGLKAQEIVEAKIEDIHDDGAQIHYCCRYAAPGRWGVRFRGLVRTYEHAAAHAIRDWLSCLADQEIWHGALWRSIAANGSLRPSMAVSAIGGIVRDRVQKAGLSKLGFSSRSLARGQVEALLADIPLSGNEAQIRIREYSSTAIRSLAPRK